MKCCTGWNYTPYLPADRAEDLKKPFICRLAPRENALELEFLNLAEKGTHTLHWSRRAMNNWQTKACEIGTVVLDNLKTGSEYEFYVESPSGVKSATRLARIGFVPGTVVNYLHPEDRFFDFSGRFLCSPSIVRVPSGALLAMMDVYCYMAPQNLQVLFRSDDDGKTWRYLTDIFPSFWGTLFMHHGALYCIGVSREYGDLLIGRSDDEGKTWSNPTVLMRGSASSTENGLHRAPMVITQAFGRLWTGMDYGSWAKHQFANGLFSIDENADLLDAANWVCTGFWKYDGSLPGADPGATQGAIEDNAVEGPDGKMVIFSRYAPGKALKLSVDPTQPEKLPEFVSFVDFPMAHTKFEIRRRASDGLYIAVGNRQPLRTVLSVYTSTDLDHWTFRQDILNYEDMPLNDIGFQYPAYIFDGDNELLVLSRTAFNGAANFHDSNYMTFHRVKLDF